MFHRILIIMICGFGVACIDDPASQSTSSAALTGEGVDFATLFDELVAAQRPTPADPPVDVDPASVIDYSSIEDIKEIEAKACDASTDKAPSAACFAAIAARVMWSEKPSSGCKKIQVCKLSGKLFGEITAKCRNCTQCCVTNRDGSRSCTTSSCGREYVVR